MARAPKHNESFRLDYGNREAESNDTIMDCSITFDNPRDDSVIIHRLNTWLQAIGRTEIVVSPKKLPKGE